MKIVKIAAGGQRTIIIEIDNETGEIHSEVVNNIDGAGCDRGHGQGDENKNLLKDLFATSVEGVGDIEFTDDGLTEIGFRERMKNVTSPISNNPTSPIKQKPGAGTPIHKELPLDSGGLGV